MTLTQGQGQGRRKTKNRFLAITPRKMVRFERCLVHNKLQPICQLIVTIRHDLSSIDKKFATGQSSRGHALSIFKISFAYNFDSSYPIFTKFDTCIHNMKFYACAIFCIFLTVRFLLPWQRNFPHYK